MGGVNRDLFFLHDEGPQPAAAAASSDSSFFQASDATAILCFLGGNSTETK